LSSTTSGCGTTSAGRCSSAKGSFGRRELAYELATRGLADEIHFWVNPAVSGSGERAFHGRQLRMQLIATTAFDSGITLLCYRPPRSFLDNVEVRPTMRARGGW
jgi:hypothetical protein